MKNVIVFIILACWWGCKESENNYNLIPFPSSVVSQVGQFTLMNGMSYRIHSEVDLDQIVVQDFIKQLSLVSGLSFDEVEDDADMTFTIDSSIEREGYRLDVDKDGIKLVASNASGLLYGIQTIYQLMPVEVYARESVEKEEWTVQNISVADAPRFSYRGMHLDVGRHFYDVDYIKKYIDILAFHKMNVFHWHLTEDQGWRIEIKKYPKLTEIGSVRKHTMVGRDYDKFDDTPYGGFYTQEDIKEVVEYARRKCITIIPEIDLPGHMKAALASYPELGCTGGPYEVSGQWGVRKDVLCVGKEKTFQFIEDVLLEAVDLFPSQYIHIGGDECPKVRWETCSKCQAKIKQLGLKDDELFKKEHYLQSYVIKRVEKFLERHDRRLIGWDEILEGGLSPNATVMSWTGVEGGIKAANLGHDVIMTPVNDLYFDYAQSSNAKREPLGMGGNIHVKKVYDFEPIVEGIDSLCRKHILGVQANVWTEYMKDEDHLEYMYLPRMTALSEVQWCKKEAKDYERFLRSMATVANRYDVMEYNYAKHIFDAQASYASDTANGHIEVNLKSYGNTPIYYTLDGSTPNERSLIFNKPFHVDSNITLKATTGNGYVLEQPFCFNKATCKTLVAKYDPHSDFTFDGLSVLADGRRGGLDFHSGEWIGFHSDPMDIVINFGAALECSLVKLGVLSKMGNWVFPPSKVEIWGSENGFHFDKIAEQEFDHWQVEEDAQSRNYECHFDPINLKCIRVIAYPIDKMPAWHSGSGSSAFLFVDELSVE